jgi:hypothetical protein
MAKYQENELKLYNSIKGEKEVFTSITEGRIGMYVCGPTVYSNVHLGNCRTFISFDMIFRYLKHLGYKVRYVRNITDAGHLTDEGDEGDDPPEDFPLGNSKKPGTGTTAVKKGNGHSGSPVAWMVPNVNIKNFVHAHVGAVSYGFAPNSDPVPGFHNHVLKTMVKDEDNPFFTTKNVGEDSLVDLVNRDGDVIVTPAVTTRGNSIEKKVTAVIFFTRYEQSPQRLNALFSGFLGTLNNAKWNGTTLNQKVSALTPERFITPCDGIGAFVGRSGCEKLISRFWTYFTPCNRWGKDHRDLLGQIWNPGGWTLNDATYFGAPLSWLKQAERDRYDEQVAERNQNAINENDAKQE